MQLKHLVQRVRHKFSDLLFRPAALQRIAHEILKTSDQRLTVGPFAGMKYLDRAHGSCLLPKLLGTYESELHPWINEILQTKYDTIIDIGCAEGFYAVGFALQCRAVQKVFAYDTDPNARQAVKDLAELNHVSHRLEIKCLCNAREIQAVSDGSTLIFCDVEGSEMDLLNPNSCPCLLECHILVECHDGINDVHISHALRARFANSHNIRQVDYKPRDYSQMPAIGAHLSRRWMRACMNERRIYGLHWLFMEPVKNNKACLNAAP